MIKVILDGQYGSCGKGAYAAWLAKIDEPEVAVRTGSPQAGHSIRYAGEVIKLRHIPAACIIPRTKLVIPAGALVNTKVLLQEIELLESYEIDISDRLYIDPRATLVLIGDIEHEREVKLSERIGSTGEGIGCYAPLCLGE